MNSRSFLIQGKLKDKISYNLTNFTELKQGQWTISVLSVSYKSTAENATLCSLSCNLSQTTKLVNNSELLHIQQTFGVFELKTSSRKPVGLIQIGLICNPIS